MTRAAVKGMGSLLEMVECSRCRGLEWDLATLNAVHGRRCGADCAAQEQAVDDLFEAIRLGVAASAQAAYRACLRLNVIHATEYAFRALHQPGVTMRPVDVFGVGVHHFIGDLRLDGTYGVTDVSKQRVLEVCACGERFPGVKPHSREEKRYYDRHPNMNDHLEQYISSEWKDK